MIDNFNEVCVVGWGRSGIALCRLLLRLNKKIKVTEARERNNFYAPLIDEFRQSGVHFEFGGHSFSFLKGSDLIVLSPGVNSASGPLSQYIQELKTPCIGEIELCFRLTQAEFIAITGTNGKTTTSFLTYRLLRQNNQAVFLGGNIGIPVSSFVLNTKKTDTIVLEVSSFQLETIVNFRPRVAALLNVEPDHLDRYPDFESYSRAKMNIFENQKQGDWAVMNNKIKGVFIAPGVKQLFFSDEFSNENLSCVYRIGSIYGIDKSSCLSLFSQFTGLPHRMQKVRTVRGINFINDSKATNPSSTIWALNNLDGPVILIAGGKDKGFDFSPVLPYLKKVKKINIFGEAGPKLRAAFHKSAELENFSSLEDAVDNSFQRATPGDTVLFSPMCASFDMFRNYIQRGNKFIEIVKEL